MTNLQPQTEEKIRYAKWKAADIAKAFREGKRPAPGPPGWAEEQELKHLEREQEDLFKPSAPATDISSPSDMSNLRHSPPRTDFSATHTDNSSSRPADGWTDPSLGIWDTTETRGSHASNATFPSTANGVSTRRTRMSGDPRSHLAGVVLVRTPLTPLAAAPAAH
jgi:hypothetical protein